MEIRFQTRRTGITCWLLSEAINHAIQYPRSANYLVYPKMMQRESVWYYSRKKMERYGKLREIGASRSVLFPNDSVVEFITTGYHLPDESLFGLTKKFMYVDNLEAFRPSRHYLENSNCSLFDNTDDLFIGGTDEREGAFKVVVDYKEFCRNHNMLDYIKEFDRIHDFIVDTHFLQSDVVQMCRPHECEFCDKCMRRHDDCIRIGNFFAVSRRCPLYPEMLVKSLNSEINLELAKWNL